MLDHGDHEVVDGTLFILSLTAAADNAPGVQKSGIGRQLVAHALRLHPTVTLDVFELNSSARAFHTRLGFRENPVRNR
ncbi:GNAT family N-acetyltransferase [Nocardia sp. NPDC051981]|uniref:GNAT family N-acetyltransferase n=1 Tax=Nocardia sp. NPDC051981 TaxID=3155417 RepID=UPI00341FC846